MSHYEFSPREREDEARRWQYEFGVQELVDEDERDKAFRRSGDGELEE